jgi:hypothetical protein
MHYPGEHHAIILKASWSCIEVQKTPRYFDAKAVGREAAARYTTSTLDIPRLTCRSQIIPHQIKMPARRGVRITNEELLKVAVIRALPTGHPENRRNLEIPEFKFSYEEPKEKKKPTTNSGAYIQNGR